MSDARLVVAFPAMHENSRLIPVSGVQRLNPGVAAPEGEWESYTPEKLPMDVNTAMGWLGQALGYAGMFQKKGELAAIAATADDKYAGSMQAIMSELLAMSGAPKDIPDEKAMAAQRLLLLAYEREKAMLEVGDLDSDVSRTMDKLGESLGLDADDSAEIAAIAATEVDPALEVKTYDAPAEWQTVFNAFCALLPEDVVLFVDNPEILAHWIDAEVPFAPAPEAVLDACVPERPAGKWLMVEAPVATLIGKSAGSKAVVTVITPDPGV